MNASAEMPRYACHKKVWALQIFRVDGSQMIHFVDAQYAPIRASDDWIKRYQGTRADEGYYVVYDGGYASWSPSKAFEAGYSRI